MDIVTYALSKKYTQKSLDGLGALKGANCVIESIDTVPEGNRVTFSWTGTDGTIETSTMIVENGIDGNNGANGADGVGVSKIEKINTVGLVDTYRITFTDNTTYDYSVTNGQKGEQGIQGLRGEKGEQGEQGVQGVQGIQGEKGDDGYPFLIYKEYSDVSEFNKNDFPEIGLMFMIVADDATSFPVYRYTGDDSVPYRYVTDLTGGEGIKGEKGDKGEQGEQGVQGENGKDGITYIPTIGTVTSGDIASATVVTKDETSTAEFSFVLPKGDNVTVDAILSNTSENPVQNKVIKQAIDNKADKTVATTSTDGLMSAEDKGKLDAFEITTTGGKLHDKDIATTDLIPTELPANGGNADYATNAGNADKVGGKSADEFMPYIGYVDDLGAVNQNCICSWSSSTLNTPFIAGKTNAAAGICIVNSVNGLWATYFVICAGAKQCFIHYQNSNNGGFVGNWQEISTTPIKSTTVSGTTDVNGNLMLWAASENKIPICAILTGYCSSIFHYAPDGHYYLGVSDIATQAYSPNVSVGGTVYYIDE